MPLSEQFREAFIHLAVIAVAFPIFFQLAHWMRG